MPAIDLKEGMVSESEIVAQIMENVTTVGFFALKNVANFDE